MYIYGVQQQQILGASMKAFRIFNKKSPNTASVRAPLSKKYNKLFKNACIYI